MAKRAPGLTRGSKVTGKTNSPRILSSQDSQAVGRPGFKGRVDATPVDGKKSVRRVRQIDPARGITQPGADVITDAHIDLVGPQNPTIVSQSLTAPPNAGSKVVRPPRSSAPVESNRPGKVTRPGN